MRQVLLIANTPSGKEGIPGSRPTEEDITTPEGPSGAVSDGLQLMGPLVEMWYSGREHARKSVSPYSRCERLAGDIQHQCCASRLSHGGGSALASTSLLDPGCRRGGTPGEPRSQPSALRPAPVSAFHEDSQANMQRGI